LRQHLPKEVGVYAKAQIVQHIDDREEQRDTFVHSVALLKRNALAAPFELAFRKQKELESSSSGQGDLMAIHYRDEEAIYIQAAHDRVTVIFSTVFREETDRIFGKVFLQVRLIHPS
jgi:actin related protein 2/3 complex subunit 2